MHIPTMVLSVVAAATMTTLVTAVGESFADSDQRSRQLKAPPEARSLDGRGNNLRSPDLGRAKSNYRRIAPYSYADGIAQMPTLPNARYISNRIFDDLSQNLFSENSVTQWAAAWGQFIDHTIGLRDQGAGEDAPIAFDPLDPLEGFQNDLGMITFTRTPASPGTGVDSPREQLNIVSAWIDGWAVYGADPDRLEWLREGDVDNDLSNNGARLLMTDTGYLPRADARGDAASAPAMELVGALRVAPELRVIAGDIRANENIALTAVQTLFAREHNRIVDTLPDSLSEQRKFEIARRVIGALQQHITYKEFLPALGIRLDRYRGYQPNVDPRITNEFASAGYRAHSMIHGEVEIEAGATDYSSDELAALEASGIEVEIAGDEVEIAVPLNVGFANPALVEALGIDKILAGLAAESQYKNDEQIDNQLRSVMFQIPRPGAERPLDCFDGITLAECYTGVLDLGALDIERGRDHGVAFYNDLREAYGLSRISSFAALTGEDTEDFPADLVTDGADPIDNPEIMTFVALRDINGNSLELDTEAAQGEAVEGDRRTTLAARLKAIYGDVESVDAFVGLFSEPHLAGSEFGELGLAIWKHQFEAIRDGDRYFYRNDPMLRRIKDRYGISAQRTLAQVIANNTDVSEDELPTNVFTTRSLEIDSRGKAGTKAQLGGVSATTVVAAEQVDAGINEFGRSIRSSTRATG